MRINKYLAQNKYCSRRSADELIRAGKVTINGRTAQLFDQVEPADTVEIDQLALKQMSENFAYLAFNKPVGIVTHSPEKGQQSIEDILKYPKKLFPVGRLDRESSGLIILTNDGRVTGRLLDPENEREKEYLVTTQQHVTREFLKAMRSGVDIDGYRTKKCEAEEIDRITFRIVLTEGKKRQIRRMCEALGYTVTELKRIRVGSVELGKLKSGSFRELKGEELAKFLDELGLKKE